MRSDEIGPRDLSPARVATGVGLFLMDAVGLGGFMIFFVWLLTLPTN
jgi:hypothetical protein